MDAVAETFDAIEIDLNEAREDFAQLGDLTEIADDDMADDEPRVIHADKL